MVVIDDAISTSNFVDTDKVPPCPFCGKAFVEPPNPVSPIVFHPGTITDGDCALSGMGFREHQFAMLNKRHGRPIDQSGDH
jgi:hypothetical protein